MLRSSLGEKTLAPVQTIEYYPVDLKQKDQQVPGDSTDRDDDYQDPKPPKRNGDKPSDQLQEEACHGDVHGQIFSNQTHRSTTIHSSKSFLVYHHTSKGLFIHKAY